MHVTFNSLAERELNDAIQYYENEQIGLGAAFLTEVRRCTGTIVDYPEAAPIISGGVRRRFANGSRTVCSIRDGTMRFGYSP